MIAMPRPITFLTLDKDHDDWARYLRSLVKEELELDPKMEIDAGRGLARALAGDSEGAIEDFEFYVEGLKQTDRYEAGANGREEWIAELRAGRNPFDEATLEALRNE
jgi:hypothetical protein